MSVILAGNLPYHSIPANTKHLYSIYTMLGQRRRRTPTLYTSYTNVFVFSGMKLRSTVADLRQASQFTRVLCNARGRADLERRVRSRVCAGGLG